MNKKEQKQKIVPINVLSKKFLAGTMAAFMLTGAILPATSFASGADDAANDTVIEESSDDKDNKDDKNEKNENKDENKNEETVDENEDKDNKDESDDSDKKDSENKNEESDKDEKNEEKDDEKKEEEVAKISSSIVGHVDGVPVYTASESKPFTVKANDAEFDIIKLVKGIEAFAGEGEIKAEFDVSKAGDKIVDVTFTDSKSKEEKHAKVFVRVLSNEAEATEADQYFVKAKKVELNEKTELDATRLVTNLKALPEGTEVSYDKEAGELTVTFADKSEIKLKGLVEYSEELGEGDVRTKANLVQTLSDVVLLDEEKDLENENDDKDDKEADKDEKNEEKDKKDEKDDENEEREVNGVKVNLSELKTAIKAAKEIELKEGLYTKESAEAFTKALEKAEAVYENKESTQEEIDEAAKNLKTAQSKLVKAKDEDKKEDKKDKNEEKDNKENNKNDKKEEKAATKTVEDKAFGFTFELKDLVVKQGTVIKPSDFVANLDKMPKDYTLSFKDEKIAKTPELGEHEVVILATRDKTEEEKKENKTVNKEAERLKDGDHKEGEAESLPTEDKDGNKYEKVTPVGVTAKENDPDKVVIELVAKVTVTKDGKALAKPIDKPEEPKAQVKTTPAEPKRINTGKQTDAEVKQSPWLIGGIGLGIAVIIGAVYNFFIKDSDKKSENTLR